jgi:hypothetical protein
MYLEPVNTCHKVVMCKMQPFLLMSHHGLMNTSSLISQQDSTTLFTSVSNYDFHALQLCVIKHISMRAIRKVASVYFIQLM